MLICSIGSLLPVAEFTVGGVIGNVEGSTLRHCRYLYTRRTAELKCRGLKHYEVIVLVVLIHTLVIQYK